MISKIQACLLGVQIGDAMGMPWELMKPEQILEATKGQGVTGFVDPVQRKISGTMSLKAGDTTDDWQLTAANARSIIRKRHYDHMDIAREHVMEFERCTFGWGSTTRIGLKEVKEFFDSNGTSGRNPFRYVPEIPGKGCGNGVAMKIAPLAILDTVQNNKNLLACVLAHGLMTHPDARASIAAYAVARVIAAVIDTAMPPEAILEYLIRQVEDAESSLHNWLVKHEIDPFSGRLKRIRNVIADPIALREQVGTGCLALESVAFAIATFLRHPTDFRAGVLEAINAGGDTDSTASMVGAMIGANCGLDAIPKEWREFRPEYQESLKLGKELYDAASW